MVAESSSRGAKKAVTSSPSNPTHREWGKWVYISLAASPTGSLVVHYQVPKKLLPRSVDRNLIKRRLKAILTPYKASFKGKKLTIGVKVGVKTAKFEELKEDMAKILTKKR